MIGNVGIAAALRLSNIRLTITRAGLGARKKGWLCWYK